MLRVVDNPDEDKTCYIVARYNKTSLRVLASFRDKKHAISFMEAMRRNAVNYAIGLCECKSVSPVWSPLDGCIDVKFEKTAP